MWNTSEVRSITHRTAVVLSSMLLFSAATAAGATAQTLPGTGVLQSGGVDVTAGPGGAGIGVDAGETGGINAGVGPGGVNLELRAPTTPQLPTTPAQPAPPPQSGGSDPVAAPGGPTTGGAAPRTGTSPRRSAPRTTRDARGEYRCGRYPQRLHEPSAPGARRVCGTGGEPAGCGGPPRRGP
jgi:hypothetical protein